MKKTLQNTLKVGAVIALMLSAGAVSAQTTTGDIAKASNAAPKTVDGAVRVIDNKGTIKYLQSSNGITTYTNETPAGGVTTTWQLGGTLDAATEINTADQDFTITVGTAAVTGDKDGRFILNGIKEVTDGAAVTIDANTGYTLLVRDADGQVKRVLASKFVTAGKFEDVIDEDGKSLVTATGLPGIIDINKVSVYRNGAKLRANTDYKVTADESITLNINQAAPNDFTTYVGDTIEVQWVN